MRRPAILAIIALLAAAACAPAWAAEAEKPKDADKGKKAPEHKLTQSESYLSLDPIYTTIVADNRPVGLLMIGMGVDIPDAALRAEVDRSMPVLRDAYVRALLAFTVAAVHLDAQPDIATIASRLQAVTDRTMKCKGVKVLMAQVALRATPISAH